MLRDDYEENGDCMVDGFGFFLYPFQRKFWVTFTGTRMPVNYNGNGSPRIDVPGGVKSQKYLV